MRHDRGYRIAELIGADSEFMVFRIKVGRHFARVRELILVRRFFARWPIGLLSVVYIAAVTTVSRGEVHGGRTGIATFALISLGLVLAGLTAVALDSSTGRFWALVLVAVLAYRVLPPYWQVRKDPQPAVIRRAVKAGVLSLVLLDSIIGAAYAGPIYAAVILGTGVVAGSLARLFSVT